MATQKQKKRTCDVCIIGDGPSALASLSAIHEPYTLDSMTPTQVSNANLSVKRNSGRGDKLVGPSEKKVCVVDTHDGWLGGWSDNFAR